jgi:hypothetical protein
MRCVVEARGESRGVDSVPKEQEVPVESLLKEALCS